MSNQQSSGTKHFPEVPAGYPFPQLEQEVLAEWHQQHIFQRSLERPAPRGEYVMFEGPPTANNVPHVGHVVTRVVKDLFPRYRTMRGYHVARKAGWDTHGLPVEIEVEKRLGFTGKEQIETYGIAEFNRACLESVHTYERQWRAMTERVGYWTDMDHPYFTYTNRYIESLWWSLARLWRNQLLTRGYKIQPYCARCGTSLSSHEVAQNYKEADDPSVWVLFPAHPGQKVETADGGTWTTPEGLSLVAWTTTPWTLLAHVALTVHPDLLYRVIERPDQPGQLLLIGDQLETPVPLMITGEDGKPKRLDLRQQPALVRLRGEQLAGLRYRRPFTFHDVPYSYGEAHAGGPDLMAWDESGWKVVTGDYVTPTEGTGLVHTAPLFGEDDYRTGLKYGLPLLATIDRRGQVVPSVEPFAGLGFKQADPEITRDLKGRGRLLHGDRYRHNYPFCWRCDQPLLYFANDSWFIRTTAVKDRLVELNREIAWHPEHIGQGRFGKWLENVVDWALSRSRYWGTPLPIWQCTGCSERQAIGSYAELFAATGKQLPADPYDREQFDPHRPFIDDFTWPCNRCGCEMRRTEEVIDAWFDSGAMPFAQHHYPFAYPDEAARRRFLEEQFPADFISEAVDQTRGWFYTLHALGTLLFDSVAYRNCIVLGHINDETGRKMSKRLGNVVDPMQVIEDTGADALRWYFYITNPQLASRFSTRLVRESAQKLLLPLWNVLSFFTIYANLDGWHPGQEPSVDFEQRPVLDRWILLRLNRLVRETTEHMDRYRIPEAARGLEAFADELTNWYIRRSRDRFWAAAAASLAKEAAYQTLYEVLTTLLRLLAPFTPFLAEVLHRNLVRSQDPSAADSVHLEDWPEPRAQRRDDALEEAMNTVLRIVRLGHAARNSHSLKTRQPLAGVTLVSADDRLPQALAPYEELLREELNVARLSWAAERSAYVHHEVRPVYPRCGPRFGKQMKELKQVLEAADGDRLAEQLESQGRITVELSTGAAELSTEEVEVRLVEREGTATQGDRELLVALDTQLTPELIAEGLAREVVHRIQNARKEANLDYADRIRVRFSAAPELAAAINTHGTWIASETLAVDLAAADGSAVELQSVPVEDLAFALHIERVSA